MNRFFLFALALSFAWAMDSFPEMAMDIDLNQDQEVAQLFQAVETCNLELVTHLAELGADLNHVFMGDSLLHRAVELYQSCPDMLPVLLSLGVSPTTPSAAGLTPLQLAIVLDQLPAVAVLLENDMAVQARSLAGQNILAFLLNHQCFDLKMIKSLCERYPEMIEEPCGSPMTTPLHLACRMRLYEVVRAMIATGAATNQVLDGNGRAPTYYLPGEQAREFAYEIKEMRKRRAIMEAASRPVGDNYLTFLPPELVTHIADFVREPYTDLTAGDLYEILGELGLFPAAVNRKIIEYAIVPDPNQPRKTNTAVRTLRF